MGYFNGYYYKIQKGKDTVAFIPGVSSEQAFIQVISDNKSAFFKYKNAVIRGDSVCIGSNFFSAQGININLENIKGSLIFSGITPVSGDIMGLFRYFPMECRHKIISMKHSINGKLTINGEVHDFDGGTGYIEGDSGRSFPKSYIWMQANDFPDASVFASAADIPFGRFSFFGCTASVLVGSDEYRLATYNGAGAVCSDNALIIRKGGLLLVCKVIDSGYQTYLSSPVNGQMNGIIKENNNAQIEFTLLDCGKLIWTGVSHCAGFEAVLNR